MRRLRSTRSLIRRPPETLRSRFRITQGMVVNLLQRDAELDLPERENFDSLRERDWFRALVVR